MSIAGDLLFLVGAVFAIGGAVGTVLPRNPLRAAVALLVHIIALAAVYLTLYAQLLAALQLLVYAGAVVILFIFVIMMIGPDATPAGGDSSGLLVRTVSFGLMAVLTGAVAFTLANVDAGVPPQIQACAAAAGAECGQFGGVKGLGRELYGRAVVPFELVSALLLVGVVGAVAVARGRNAKEAEAVRARRAARGAVAAAGGAAE